MDDKMQSGNSLIKSLLSPSSPRKQNNNPLNNFIMHLKKKKKYILNPKNKKQNQL
ncbi:hypothetical protein GBA52_021964 [Prunus armeniaca]|nr:hypothetical protein GBA52_021964 [Prunus armeniaca]